MSAPPILVWFRRDLRLADNPALAEACATGRPVIPVFIWAPDEEAPWQPGAASRWWLHHALVALDSDLRARGASLIVRRGPSLDTLRALMRETGATDVYWNRLYDPALIARDRAIKEAVGAHTFNGALLHEPWEILTQAERPYQVFTPFYKACQVHGDPGRPLPAPARAETGHAPSLQSLAIGALELLPTLNWADGFHEVWTPGEAGAHEQLSGFAANAYATERDRPDHAGTSRLSPHLHFGEISPRQIWHALRASRQPNIEPYLRQLVWREFAHHLLYHFPHTPTQPLRPEFERFPWVRHAKALRAWQKGLTGYPIVDAGMRELWRTGWMHNRVRMIAASFLVKDLLIPWQEGARWFWDTLVDASLANNTLGWQWVAGCGADAAPYFRVFNPSLQAEKFDPDGAYRRRWAGEVAVPPIVDHGEARDRALEAYSAMRMK
jgi:deoxyribodipyrimidine photo-lyase